MAELTKSEVTRFIMYSFIDENLKKKINIHTHPGCAVWSWANSKGISQREVALRCGVSDAHVSALFLGQKRLTAAMAKKLEYAFDLNAEQLLTMQVKNEKQLYYLANCGEFSPQEQRQVDKLTACYADLAKNQAWAHLADQSNIPVYSLRRALKVSNLLRIPQVARALDPRLTRVADKHLYQVFAWYMLSTQLSGACPDQACLPDNRHLPASGPYSRDKLTAKIPAISDLTSNTTQSLKRVLPELKRHLFECGITLITFTSVANLFAKGYIKKNADLTLLVCIKDAHEEPRVHRYELFHLLGHIVNGDLARTKLLIDHDSIKDAADKKADRFAAQFV